MRGHAGFAAEIEEGVSWFFTPSRPVRLYQGDEIEGEEQESERKKKQKEKEDKPAAEDTCLSRPGTTNPLEGPNKLHKTITM